MRKYSTGATRNDDSCKNDYEGFISPLFIEAYGNYMHKHRKQADGKLRDSDNWQKGIPQDDYMKSLLRHTLDLWLLHRGYVRYDRDDGHRLTKIELLCAIFFNAQGYAYEELKKKEKPIDDILPKRITPTHLVTWAKEIDEERGYESILTKTLRHIAKKLKETKNTNEKNS